MYSRFKPSLNFALALALAIFTLLPSAALAKVGSSCVADSGCEADVEICSLEIEKTFDSPATCNDAQQCKDAGHTGAGVGCDAASKKCVEFEGTCINKADAPELEESSEPFEATAPILGIKIPGFKGFSEAKIVEDEDGKSYATFPWIGEYFSAIYAYLLGITGLVVLVVFMTAGLEYLTSGGNSAAVGRAKDRMKNATVGMLLMFGSYTVLSIINPDLVKFKGLRVQIFEREPIVFHDRPAEPDQDPLIKDHGKPISDTTYDDVFKSYAGCAGVDWRALKSIAFKESRLNATVKNSAGFIGLFQTKQKFCLSTLKSYGASHMCSNLRDPNNNTAVGSIMLRNNAKKIKKKCPNASVADFYTFVYLGHNAGSGSLSKALKGGCDAASAQKAFVAFWTKLLSKKNPAKHDFYKENAEKRFRYAQKVSAVVLAQGVTSKDATGSCPLLKSASEVEGSAASSRFR